MVHPLPMLFHRWLSIVHVSAALGSCLVAGVFFAFSSFVLPALARLPPAQGVTAMQAINVAVINRSFLGAFVGTALCCGLVCADALRSFSEPGAGLRLAGGALFLLGSFLVTRARNIPYNDALSRLVPEAAGSADAWRRFVAAWSFWNHVRTAAALGAATLLVLGLGSCARS